MLLGFQFNGVHSSSFGLVMLSKNRPVLPEPKIVTEEVPARHGVYDFSAANPYGHVMYKEREVTVDCKFISDGIFDLRKKVRGIAAWLACGEARLVFDDEQTMYYLARVSNRINLEQQISKIGCFSIVFTCRPFAYSSVISGEIPEYGRGLFYSDIAEYGGINRYVVNNNGVTPSYDPGRGFFDIDPFTFKVGNAGNYVRPKIVMTGSFTNLRISLGIKYLQYSQQQSSGTLIFDCESRKAVSNGTNISNLISGQFFELAHGNNIMQIYADEIDCTMSFIFNFLYF